MGFSSGPKAVRKIKLGLLPMAMAQNMNKFIGHLIISIKEILVKTTMQNWLKVGII